MSDPDVIQETLNGVVDEMHESLTTDKMDRFRELSKQRDRILQWLCGLVSFDRSSSSSPVDTLTALRQLRLPQGAALDAIIRKAVADNHALIQTAQVRMAETKRKIDKLTQHRTQTHRLATSYGGSRRSGYNFSSDV